MTGWLLVDCSPNYSTFEQVEPSTCEEHKCPLQTCYKVAGRLRELIKQG